MSAIDAYAGESPAKIVWNIVRGDDSSIEITLLDDNGQPLSAYGWSYASKARGSSQLYSLTVTSVGNVVTVKAPSATTSLWGAGATTNPAAQLPFDLQVTKGDGSKWTPVIGKIVVIPDVS
jgi:hypothetical protein